MFSGEKEISSLPYLIYKMNNCGPPAGTSDGYFSSSNMSPSGFHVSVPNQTNKYVYVKQNLVSSSHHQTTVIPKVLVNPHFNKKVFVNPNFNVNNVLPPTSIPKIHVNPNVKKLNLNNTERTSVQKIHINPNVLRNIPTSLNTTTKNYTAEISINDESKKNVHHTMVSAQATLAQTPIKIIPTENKPRKRRSSVRSKFKIVRSSAFENSIEPKSKKKRRASILSKYKMVKSTCSKQSCPQNLSKNCTPMISPMINKFKLDNRCNKTTLHHKNKKYVYVNRFLSISDLARNGLLKQNFKISKSAILNISGILYKKSPNCLRRASDTYKKTNIVKKTQENTVCKSKYKFVRKSMNKIIKNEDDARCLKQSEVLRTLKVKKNISPRKLQKCNIPCPYYRKFGRCSGRNNGKCYRKHDPDQIALCTKFLQGACVDSKCLLSHNVSPEKMPACKFYLEGSCSRDDCPYLHVRISPKADICRNFLEGFCKEAAECDKRHQFLCPDYEKTGNCLKQRCPYPHGKMVRKYSVFNKNKFAKKSSEFKKEIRHNNKHKESNILIGENISSSKSENLNVNHAVNVKTTRYYVEQKVLHTENLQDASNNDQKNSNDVANCDQEVGIRSRPKLGKLPSFIAFEEV